MSLEDALQGIIVSDIPDRFFFWCSMDSIGDFLVNVTRSHINNVTLPDGGSPTRWYKEVPLRVNIFIWRLSLYRLSTRLNLSMKCL